MKLNLRYGLTHSNQNLRYKLFFHIKNQQGRRKKCGEEVEGTEEVNEC
jgi:hypothetical protein